MQGISVCVAHDLLQDLDVEVLRLHLKELLGKLEEGGQQDLIEGRAHHLRVHRALPEEVRF